MALVHTHKGRLPEARALLYEETIDILLWRWEQVKAGGEDEAPPLERFAIAFAGHPFYADRHESLLSRFTGTHRPCL
jgi:hypothetical protein